MTIAAVVPESTRRGVPRPLSSRWGARRTRPPV